MKELDQPKTTVWGWIRDVELTEEQRARIHSFGADRCKVASQQKATQAMVAKYAILKEDAKNRGRQFIKSFGRKIPIDVVAAVMAYWAEGTKGDGRSGLWMANSDPKMIVLFHRFMVDRMSIRVEDVRVSLNFYDNLHSVSDVEGYWSSLLNISSDKFYKHQVNKKPQAEAGKKFGKLPYGVCTIGNPSRYRWHEMYGMIEALQDKLNLDA